MDQVVDVPSGQRARVSTPQRGDPVLGRLSLNQRTTPTWSVLEAVDGCVEAGVPGIGLWREDVANIGLDRAVRAVRAAGLRVSSLCRGGFLTQTDPDARRTALEDNRRAIDEAAGLGAATLVVVVGGLPAGSRDLEGARGAAMEGIEALVPYARERGVRLAVEPLHPMYCADRAVVSSLAQALTLVEPFPAAVVGVVVDTFHIWWEPDVHQTIAAAGERIASVQVSDWVTPLPADVLLGRSMMGDGHIDFGSFARSLAASGYEGDVEVEIFSDAVWSADPTEVVATMARRVAEYGLTGQPPRAVTAI